MGEDPSYGLIPGLKRCGANASSLGLRHGRLLRGQRGTGFLLTTLWADGGLDKVHCVVSNHGQSTVIRRGTYGGTCPLDGGPEPDQSCVSKRACLVESLPQLQVHREVVQLPTTMLRDSYGKSVRYYHTHAFTVDAIQIQAGTSTDLDHEQGHLRIWQRTDYFTTRERKGASANRSMAAQRGGGDKFERIGRGGVTPLPLSVWAGELWFWAALLARQTEDDNTRRYPPILFAKPFLELPIFIGVDHSWNRSSWSRRSYLAHLRHVSVLPWARVTGTCGLCLGRRSDPSALFPPELVPSMLVSLHIGRSSLPSWHPTCRIASEHSLAYVRLIITPFAGQSCWAVGWHPRHRSILVCWSALDVRSLCGPLAFDATSLPMWCPISVRVVR
ncbi:hypothetical protein R1flu_028799 [Riccia fluitans]|uniref:Uncharacterized protein n=1 Tax=Riccia fluitans TaxID=41844 RepID=A0ABD1XQP9_9MARC